VNIQRILLLISIPVVITGCVTSSSDVTDPLSFVQEPPSNVSVTQTKELAEHGNSKAQYLLGLLSFKGIGIEKDINEAIRWFTSASENGEVKADVILV